MKRLAMLILVLMPVLGFCDNQIVCNGDYTPKDFGETYIIGNDRDYIYCFFDVEKIKTTCRSSIDYTEDPKLSELYNRNEFSKNILELPHKIFKEYHQSIFDSLECKLLDKELNDITPYSSKKKQKVNEEDVEPAPCYYTNNCEE